MGSRRWHTTDRGDRQAERHPQQNGGAVTADGRPGAPCCCWPWIAPDALAAPWRGGGIVYVHIELNSLPASIWRSAACAPPNFTGPCGLPGRGVFWAPSRDRWWPCSCHCLALVQQEGELGGVTSSIGRKALANRWVIRPPLRGDPARRLRSLARARTATVGRVLSQTPRGACPHLDPKTWPYGVLNRMRARR